MIFQIFLIELFFFFSSRYWIFTTHHQNTLLDFCVLCIDQLHSEKNLHWFYGNGLWQIIKDDKWYRNETSQGRSESVILREFVSLEWHSFDPASDSAVHRKITRQSHIFGSRTELNKIKAKITLNFCFRKCWQLLESEWIELLNFTWKRWSNICLSLWEKFTKNSAR